MNLIEKLDKKWQKIIINEIKKDYYKNIKLSIKSDIDNCEIIYPPLNDTFNAFLFTNFDNIKAVIIGQDPYHNENQAHGLSFSVNDGIKIPPSLKNIFKELNSDLGIEIPKSGKLNKWAENGVLLLNSILSVKKGQPASHSKIGWEKFTDTIIQNISDKKENVIFILWGNFAKNKKKLIDENKHLIIESSHPSPFSAYNGFFGSKPFSKTNRFLEEKGISKINWNL